MNSRTANNQTKTAKNIDWNNIRRKIDDTRNILEKGWTPTSEQKKLILQSRARALALEPEKEEKTESINTVVEFILAFETYGVELSFVREVVPLKELTVLPGTPQFVLGVTNVRGSVISVIDIKKFFDLPEKGLTDLNKLIILDNEKMEFGILADAITGIRNISLNDIQPSLPTLTGIRTDYLKGVTKERVVVLDALKLLSDNKIIHCE